MRHLASHLPGKFYYNLDLQARKVKFKLLSKLIQVTAANNSGKPLVKNKTSMIPPLIPGKTDHVSVKKINITCRNKSLGQNATWR